MALGEDLPVSPSKTTNWNSATSSARRLQYTDSTSPWVL